jgi:polyadenylate-binding protein
MARIQVQSQQQQAYGHGSTNVPNPLVSTTLYVGDLEPTVTDSQIYDLFHQIDPVLSARICKDVTTNSSLGYAYVIFSTVESANRALDQLNFKPLNGNTIRIMYANCDPSISKSGLANIFIKNLDKAVDAKVLYQTFCVFGTILSCKIATDDASGQSKGYGYVQFEEDEGEQVNGMTKFNNVFVKNLAESVSDEDLRDYFGESGTITSVVVMRDADEKSKCFGFVNFENADDAANSVKSLNGKKIDGKEWYVGKAQKKYERESDLRRQFEKMRGANLYVKNLDESIDDDKLRQAFHGYGTITSCKVMRDFDGHSKGSGFVAFSSPDEASRALAEMNMKMVGRKPLYVARAESEEERSAKLQAHFSHQLPNPVGNGSNNVFNRFVSTSLYVGDLEPNVTHSQIFYLFERTGRVLSVRICEDVNTNRSLGYAYVNYSSIESSTIVTEISAIFFKNHI